MPRELVSELSEVAATHITPIKVGRIQGIIERNRSTIISLIILTPSITIPAYYDCRHPIVGMILGGLTMAGITILGIEQMTNAEKEFEHLKPKNFPE